MLRFTALMLDLQPATFEEFTREAARGNVVPVVRTVLADLQTPVSAHVRVTGDAPYSFLLESVVGSPARLRELYDAAVAETERIEHLLNAAVSLSSTTARPWSRTRQTERGAL